MNTDLFTSLRKYHPREGHDPLENFITEAFAWLLRSDKIFSHYFINEILDNLGLKKTEINFNENTIVRWNTQSNWGRHYPDLTCEFGEYVLIFEHKTHNYDVQPEQLNNYRKYANSRYKNPQSVIIITGSTHQHNPKHGYDLALCWSDIIHLINKWMKNDNCRNDYSFLFQSFLNLLKNEGLGPNEAISQEAIRGYYPSKDFLGNIDKLISKAYKHPWYTLFKIDNIDLQMDNAWDRKGFRIFASKPWTPSLFIGFITNNQDFRSKPVLGNISPDFCITISTENILYPQYSNDLIYKEFIKKLASEIAKLNLDLDFYEHHADKTIQNYNNWHPIHIRKPMLELFKATQTTEEQQTAFIETASKILNAIIDCEEFWQIRQSYSTKLKS